MGPVNSMGGDKARAHKLRHRHTHGYRHRHRRRHRNGGLAVKWVDEE